VRGLLDLDNRRSGPGLLGSEIRTGTGVCRPSRRRLSVVTEPAGETVGSLTEVRKRCGQFWGSRAYGRGCSMNCPRGGPLDFSHFLLFGRGRGAGFARATGGDGAACRPLVDALAVQPRRAGRPDGEFWMSCPAGDENSARLEAEVGGLGFVADRTGARRPTWCSGAPGPGTTGTRGLSVLSELGGPGAGEFRSTLGTEADETGQALDPKDLTGQAHRRSPGTDREREDAASNPIDPGYLTIGWRSKGWIRL